MAIKKPKIDPEILKRRNAERASANRERKRIEESHRESVLSMIAHDNYNDKLYSPSVFRPGMSESYWDQDRTALWRRQTSALAYVLGQRAQSVLTSFGINPSVTVTEDTSLDMPVIACTNFKDIEILVNLNKVDFKDMESVAEVLMAIKGVVYHEGGHILHTLGFDVLFDCALMDNKVEPISIVRHARWGGDYMQETYPAYKGEESEFRSPYVSMTEPIDKVVSDNIRIVPDGRSTAIDEARYNLNDHYHQFGKVKDWVRPAWNCLEDGRMEDIVVRNTPSMAGYLEAVTLKLIVEPSKHPGSVWPMIAARTYLSDDVYHMVKELAVEYLEQQGKPLEMIEECEELVRNFRRSTTPTEVVVSSWEFATFLHRWVSNEHTTPKPPHGGGRWTRGENRDHHKGSQEPKGASSPGEHPTSIDKNDEITEKPKFENEEIDPQSTNKGRTAGSGSQQSQETGEGEGQGSPTKSDKPSLSDQEGKGGDKEDSRPLDRGAGSDGTGGQIKHNVNYAELRKQLKDRIIKATKSVSSVTDAEQFMSDVNKELSKPLIRTQATTALSNELIDKANKVAGAMLNALAPLAVTADPAWRFRQENGVLDPVSYKTHEPGDSDYWIDYEGEGSTGHSLSVSVLLDTSGSMDAWMDELSVAAYGIRLACDSLEIPCTVSTFDTDAYMLYPHEEDVAPLLIHDGGGTNPRAALKQVENQKAGKQRQLVVVLTDGAWSDVKSIKPFVQPGQYWVLTALGDGAYAGTYVEGKGADVTLVINDVAELPKKVEQSLSNFLA